MSCSKKNWAYTFLGFGITFLVVGVICGFLIPRITIGVVEDTACVDSRTDSNYDDWVKEKPGSIITKLYYWEITNKDGFLFKGESPQLKERGPYVYRQTTQKIEPTFKGNTRSSKTWKKDAKFDESESCETCKEDDEVTVLNVGYMGLMEKAEGDMNFATAYFSSTITILIQEFNNSYEQLGNTRQTIWKDPRKSNWTEPGFAAFIHKNDPNLNTNITGNFTEVQMRGLYSVLSNQTLFYGETLTNKTLREQCLKNPEPRKCGTYAKIAAIGIEALGANIFVSDVNETLCPTATQCFNRTDLLQDVFLYIQHVHAYTMWVFLKNYELVSRMPQKQIALGYTMKNITDPRTGSFVSVPGIITVHNTKEVAKKEDEVSTFYTCEAGDSKKHQWESYNGKKNISTIPNLTPEDSKIYGYDRIMPRSKTADKPCTFSHELPYKKIEIFNGALAMRVTVRYEGETTLHGLDLKRFTPDKDDFLNHSGVQEGYIDFSKRHQLPAFVTMAHMLYVNNTNYPASFNQNPVLEKHQSVVDIEAVTGLLTRGFMKLQLNVAIRDTMVEVPRTKGPLRISYLATGSEKLYHKSIPVLWGEYGGEANEDDIDKIKQKVIGTLGLACGILIALPVLGGIFIVVATALFVIAAKANQIAEMSK